MKDMPPVIRWSYFKNGLILFHVLFTIVGLYIFFYNYEFSQTLLIQQNVAKEGILSRAGASSVENLFKNIENQVQSFAFSFANIDETAVVDKANTREQFVRYISRTNSPVTGIALYDEIGKLVIIENKEHVTQGETQVFSDLDFIQWSKDPLNKNKVYISTPYVSRAGSAFGKTIIVVASPVYFGNRYKGTLAIRVLVAEFKKAFIDPLEPNIDEDALVISQDGTVVAGRDDLLNVNLFSYAQEKKWKGYEQFTDILHQALRKNQSSTSWIFQQPKENPKLFLGGVSKIDVPNTDRDLYMILNTSQEAVVAPLRNLQYYGIAWLGLGLLTTTIGSLLVLAVKNF